jgi:LuxR family quorum sensing-dependent transcriptional regulator
MNITPREKEVIKWVADGKTAWEISTILHLSEHTIRNHIENARRKFDATNTAHLIAAAFRNQLIS